MEDVGCAMPEHSTSEAFENARAIHTASSATIERD